MRERRSLADRFLALGTPSVVPGYAPPPVALDAGLWTLERRLRMPGGPLLPSRTTVLGLPGGGVAVISPPPAAAGGLDALDALGEVRAVVAPNTFHYLYAAELLARHPDAVFLRAPGLAARVPSLPPGRDLAPGPFPGAAGIEVEILGPVRGCSEAVFFHEASATLVLTDVAFHMVDLPRRFDRIAWRLAGVPAGFGPSRSARMMLLRDAGLAGGFVRHVLAWPFRRILVAHGEPLEEGAKDAFRRAFQPWLA